MPRTSNKRAANGRWQEADGRRQATRPKDSVGDIPQIRAARHKAEARKAESQKGRKAESQKDRKTARQADNQQQLF